MADVFTCQSQHSRNAYDWQYEADSTGRHVLKARGKGVWQRIGKVVKNLFKAEGCQLSSRQLVKILQKIHPSFSENDLSRVAVHLKKHNIIEIHGRGPEAVWRLTAKGRRMAANWSKSATVEWV